MTETHAKVPVAPLSLGLLVLRPEGARNASKSVGTRVKREDGRSKYLQWVSVLVVRLGRQDCCEEFQGKQSSEEQIQITDLWSSGLYWIFKSSYSILTISKY
jgi:hypothetical protein